MTEYIIEYDEALAVDVYGRADMREEIVRCRDCKWFIKANSLTGWNDVCNLTDSNVVPNGFCAWGERREV